MSISIKLVARHPEGDVVTFGNASGVDELGNIIENINGLSGNITLSGASEPHLSKEP
jgi:hypothetical protein